MTHQLGGIDTDIERIFLNLEPASLYLLLQKYGAKYGSSAAQYAKDVYPRWQSGEVRLSGQTARRLLELVPPYLPAATRFELIRKLRSHCLVTSAVELTCTPENWRTLVAPAIRSVVDRYQSQSLPADVTALATWLTNDDAQAAQRLLSEAASAEAEVRTSLLPAEFARIDALLRAHASRSTGIVHTIRIPQGTVRVSIQAERPSFFASVAESLSHFFR